MIRIRPLEKSNVAGIKTRKGLPSLCCLPALIEEIDERDHEPVGVELAYLLARYKTIELNECKETHREMASKMVNAYLIDVLWRTRDERNGEANRRRRESGVRCPLAPKQRGGNSCS